MCSNQRIQITIFEGVIVKIKKFPGKLRMFMPELKQQGSKMKFAKSQLENPNF